MTKLLSKNDEYHFIVTLQTDPVNSKKVQAAIHENNIILDDNTFREDIINKMEKQGQMCHTVNRNASPTPHPETYESFNTFKTQNIFYVINNGIVRACSIFNIVTDHIYINVICNDPRYGKGYGKILINKIIDICRSLGLSSIQLYSDEDEKLLGYYKTIGFKPIHDDDEYFVMLKVEPIPSPKHKNETRPRISKLRSRASRMTVSKKYKKNVTSRSSRKTPNSL